MKKKVVTILGARPQFIKSSALSRELKKLSNVEEILVHTGQHFDRNMSEIFFKELEISLPKYSLNISGGSHGEMTGKMLNSIDQVLSNEKPNMVIVYGDTNSTLAGALSASKMNIPVVHIEAGLRSFNKAMPEEINRIITDHTSKVLFCPTKNAMTNLRNEGIRNNVFHVGDIMYDASVFAKKIIRKNRKKLSDKFSFIGQKYAILTIHRDNATKNAASFSEIYDFAKIFTEQKGLKLVFPAHPRLRNIIENFKLRQDVIEPLSYFEMQYLLSKATYVLTDSGGLQKEAYFHRIPCITLRKETEWIETIEAGWNKLWKDKNYSKKKTILDYGQGDTAMKITKILDSHL